MQQHNDPDSPRTVRGWRQAYTGKTLPLDSLAPALPPAAPLARLVYAHPTLFRRLNTAARVVFVLVAGSFGTTLVAACIAAVLSLVVPVTPAEMGARLAWAVLIAVVACLLHLRGRTWRYLLLFAAAELAVVLATFLLYWLLDTLQR